MPKRINHILLQQLVTIMISCFASNGANKPKQNLFVIPFMKESPIAISCEDLERHFDTAVYITDTRIAKLITSKMDSLKLSRSTCSDFRINLKPAKATNDLKEFCIDRAGKIRIGNKCYEKDPIIRDSLLIYLPKNISKTASLPVFAT